MPTIKRFGGFSVYVYPDHNPPHVHLAGPDWQAVVLLEDLSIAVGRVPAGDWKRFRRWAQDNRADLVAAWNRLNPQ